MAERGMVDRLVGYLLGEETPTERSAERAPEAEDAATEREMQALLVSAVVERIDAAEAGGQEGAGEPLDPATLAAYLDGTLPAAEKWVLERRLGASGDALQEVAAARRWLAELAERKQRAPAALVEEVLAKTPKGRARHRERLLSRALQRLRVGPRVPAPRARWVSAGVAAAAALALVIAAVTGVFAPPERGREIAGTAPGERALGYALSEAPKALRSGVVTANPAVREAIARYRGEPTPGARADLVRALHQAGLDFDARQVRDIEIKRGLAVRLERGEAGHIRATLLADGLLVVEEAP